MVTLTNIDYPHFATISRNVTDYEPPATTTVTEIWSGNVDCQMSKSGGTSEKQSVFVSDYTIYSACIESELQTGDIITITLKEDATPFDCTIEQSSTEEVWIEEDGTRYGTTIWANKVNA